MITLTHDDEHQNCASYEMSWNMRGNDPCQYFHTLRQGLTELTHWVTAGLSFWASIKQGASELIILEREISLFKGSPFLLADQLYRNVNMHVIVS